MQRAGHAGGAAHILDDDRLAEEFAHALRLNARADIDAAAGSERHDRG